MAEEDEKEDQAEKGRISHNKSVSGCYGAGQCPRIRA